MARARTEKPEKVTLHLVKGRFGALMPATQFDEERLARFRTGSTLAFPEPHQPLNADKQRLYRAVVSKVAKAIGVDADVLHIRLKLATGRVCEVAVWDDDVRLIPISVADMDGPAFDSYFDDAILHISTEIVPGMTIEDILDTGGELLKTKVTRQ